MVIASAAIAVIAGIYLIEFDNGISNESTWLAMVLVSTLGVCRTKQTYACYKLLTIVRFYY
jgi:hypothetical protein